MANATLLNLIRDKERYLTAVRTLARGKQPGPNGIPNELLKCLPSEWHDLIHDLFTVMWILGQCPTMVHVCRLNNSMRKFISVVENGHCYEAVHMNMHAMILLGWSLAWDRGKSRLPQSGRLPCSEPAGASGSHGWGEGYQPPCALLSEALGGLAS
jgi:hypothetical protein